MPVIWRSRRWVGEGTIGLKPPVSSAITSSACSTVRSLTWVGGIWPEGGSTVALAGRRAWTPPTRRSRPVAKDRLGCKLRDCDWLLRKRCTVQGHLAACSRVEPVRLIRSPVAGSWSRSGGITRSRKPAAGSTPRAPQPRRLQLASSTPGDCGRPLHIRAFVKLAHTSNPKAKGT